MKKEMFKNLMAVFAGLILGAFASFTLPETSAQSALFDGTTIDSVVLTGEEVGLYNAMLKGKADRLQMTNTFLDNTVKWIDAVAPGVIENANVSDVIKDTLRSHTVQMRSDFITLGKMYIEQMSAVEVTGRTIRTVTLTNDVEREQAILERAEAALTEANTQGDADFIVSATTVRDEAATASGEAQAALDAWLGAR